MANGSWEYDEVNEMVRDCKLQRGLFGGWALIGKDRTGEPVHIASFNDISEVPAFVQVFVPDEKHDRMRMLREVFKDQI